MPQEIRVLQCFACNMYQVDIVKKAPRWQCKVCGEKQSVFKEHFRGSGPDCRLKAQQLNLDQGEKLQKMTTECLNSIDDGPDRFNQRERSERSLSSPNNMGGKSRVSKWSAYAD